MTYVLRSAEMKEGSLLEFDLPLGAIPVYVGRKSEWGRNFIEYLLLVEEGQAGGAKLCLRCETAIESAFVLVKGNLSIVPEEECEFWAHKTLNELSKTLEKFEQANPSYRKWKKTGKLP